MNIWENIYTHLETPIGAGFYALRENTSASGSKYTKLVTRFRGPGNHIDHTKVTQPSIGHNARRQIILDKRKEKQHG